MENFTKEQLADALFEVDVEQGWEKKNDFNKMRKRYLKEGGAYLEMSQNDWPKELCEKLGTK